MATAAGLSPARWSGRAAALRRQAVAATAVRGLSRLVATWGFPAGPDFLLDCDVIEAFCVAACAA